MTDRELTVEGLALNSENRYIVMLTTGVLSAEQAQAAADGLRDLGLPVQHMVEVVEVAGVPTNAGTFIDAELPEEHLVEIDPEVLNDTVAALLGSSDDARANSRLVAARNACERDGVATVRDLLIVGSVMMRDIRNIGEQTIDRLRAGLAERGLEWQEQVASIASIAALCDNLDQVPLMRLDRPRRAPKGMTTIGELLRASPKERRQSFTFGFDHDGRGQFSKASHDDYLAAAHTFARQFAQAKARQASTASRRQP